MFKSTVAITGTDISSIVDLCAQRFDCYTSELITCGSCGSTSILVYEHGSSLLSRYRVTVTIVFGLSEKGKCTVAIVSGGGEEHLIFDQCKKINTSVIRALNEICDDNEWELAETTV